MALTFTAVFEQVSESEGGGYVAYAEELRGAITEGETIEEARENLQDAINELLEGESTARIAFASGTVTANLLSLTTL